MYKFDLIHSHPNLYPYFITAIKHWYDVLFLDSHTSFVLSISVYIMRLKR